MPQKSPNNFHHIVIFCDGACSGNPGPGGWGGIVATPDGSVLELGGRNPLTTNNQMELTATIESLRSVNDRMEEISLYTDSQYVILGITKWIWGWKKRGWITAEGKEVLNRDLWQELSNVVTNRKDHGSTIAWKYVRGHTGITGNERADEIAVGFAQSRYPKLYRGSLLQYGVPIHDVPEKTETPVMKSSKPKVAAYSYVSLVGGIPFRHKTWAECERRVRGQSNAKFKKALSEGEESTILKSWGIDPAKLNS